MAAIQDLGIILPLEAAAQERELFMDVISDELAKRSVEKSGHQAKAKAYRAVKQDIIRRYGGDIHLSFLHG